MSLDAQQLRNLMDEVYRNADAQWPTRLSEVSAERLIRHWLIRAQVHVGMLDGLDPQSKEWSQATERLVGMFSLAQLLQPILDAYPVVAEHLAREVWSTAEDGAGVFMGIWSALDVRGLQPDAIRVVGLRTETEMDNLRATLQRVTAAGLQASAERDELVSVVEGLTAEVAHYRAAIDAVLSAAEIDYRPTGESSADMIRRAVPHLLRPGYPMGWKASQDAARRALLAVADLLDQMTAERLQDRINRAVAGLGDGEQG